MPARLRLGAFDLDVAVYTADASFYHPAAWKREGEGHVADGLLLAGQAGEPAVAGSRVEITPLPAAEGCVKFRASLRHAGVVKAVKFGLELPYMPMLAPEQIELREATWRQWDFPRDWCTGFAVWRDPRDGRDRPRHFTVVTHDAPWRFKRLRALRNGDRMRLEIIQDAAIRERGMTMQTSEWEIGWRDDVEPMLAAYADFVGQAFGAAAFERRADVPAWTRRVGLVVNLHGTDWNGRRNLDYAGMTAAAEAIAGLFDADRTILYLIGWDGRYMRDYPDYRPSAELSGMEGFAAFCRRARGLGFHVMPHLNAMAVNMRHRLYLTHLKDYVMRDAAGVPQHSFKIDWDHDGLGDAAHAYISLVPPALREILAATVDRLVADFGIDAVFFDETCNVFYNDPAWDQVEGVRKLVRDVRSRHPDVLVAGEEWNEMLLGLTPLVQIWEETADGRKGFEREKSPLMRRWAARFIRACGYLALASPDGTTGVHEWPDKPWVDEPQNESFYIPTLSITGNTLQRGMEGVRATVRRARDYVERFAR